MNINKKINLIIPLCGKGLRFTKSYQTIKPLIKVHNKEIIMHLLDNLFYDNNENDLNVFIIINKNTNNHGMQQIVHNKYKSVNFIDIIDETGGAAETVYKGLNIIREQILNNPILIMDGDSFYTFDLLNKIKENLSNNMVAYFFDNNKLAQYSYIELDNNNKILKIREKEKISDNANSGIYYFINGSQFLQYANTIITNKIMFKNEYYISTVIDVMITDGHLFNGMKIENKFFKSLGTPELVKKYIDDTKCFLFDLDGTLINSDHLYMNIWKDILTPYNIDVDMIFYETHIQGNNDETCIKKFLTKSITNDELIEISKKKDLYLCDHIKDIQEIKYSVNFLKKIKRLNHPIGIVTNCNRISAEHIIKGLNIDKYIDVLIIGSECNKSKPFPDPYLNAMKHLNVTQNNCIIFEDSKTGILSAINARPMKIIGIESKSNKQMIMNYGVNMVIQDYNEKNNELYNEILNDNIIKDEKKKNLTKNIYDSIKKNLNVKQVFVDENNLKGGYICDVINVDIELLNGEIIKTVLKKENNTFESLLSEMANKLHLYEREYYFYETISSHINIEIPKFYGIIRDENLKRIGILMENLNKSDYVLNLNLNTENIDIVLNVINNLAKMHSFFCNKNLSKLFRYIEHNNGPMSNPFWINYVNDRIDLFLHKWQFILTNKQIDILKLIVNKYDKIQNKLSEGILTLCHGDVKSTNIFYKKTNEKMYEPYMIDWQYIIEGKGTQDLVFLMIESFDISRINSLYNLIVEYYYEKFNENIKQNKTITYTHDNYIKDISYSICYFPMFVAMWFGTIDMNELNDKNFPYFFIKKFLNFIDNHLDVDLIINL